MGQWDPKWVFQPPQEHARDSFENLVFSVCRFREVTGRYPVNVVVASFEFKHERFAGLHLKALRWPGQRFRFLGTPALSEQALQVLPTPPINSAVAEDLLSE